MTRSTTKTSAPKATQRTSPRGAKPEVIEARIMRDALEAELQEGKRQLLGAVSSLLIGIVGTYSAAQFAGYVFVGAAVFTGSMFLAYVGMIITLILGIYAALIAASRAGAYVAQGHLERDVQRAKSWVTDKLTFLNFGSAT